MMTKASSAMMSAGSEAMNDSNDARMRLNELFKVSVIVPHNPNGDFHNQRGIAKARSQIQFRHNATP